MYLNILFQIFSSLYTQLYFCISVHLHLHHTQTACTMGNHRILFHDLWSRLKFGQVAFRRSITKDMKFEMLILCVVYLSLRHGKSYILPTDSMFKHLNTEIYPNNFHYSFYGFPVISRFYIVTVVPRLKFLVSSLIKFDVEYDID